MSKQIDVVAPVVIRDDTILCAQRGPSMTLPGMWEFPGGKIEPGETPQQALRRELEEELLCTINVGELVVTTRHAYDFGDITLRTFKAVLVSGEPQLSEHSEIRWIQVAQLDSVDWAPADIPTVRQLMRDLGH
jgi:8-oxo-dGTP diphosphatase